MARRWLRPPFAAKAPTRPARLRPRPAPDASASRTGRSRSASTKNRPLKTPIRITPLTSPPTRLSPTAASAWPRPQYREDQPAAAGSSKTKSALSGGNKGSQFGSSGTQKPTRGALDDEEEPERSGTTGSSRARTTRPPPNPMARPRREGVPHGLRAPRTRRPMKRRPFPSPGSR